MKRTSLIALSVAAALSGTAFAADSTNAKHGTLKSTTGDSSFKVDGRLMFDWDNFDGAHNTSNNGANASQSETRRARIAVTSQLNKYWKGKLQINYNDKKQASLKDAYIQHKGRSATFTIGKHFEPMGLEALTSSKYISTIERSMASEAFAPGRNIGISFKGHNDKFLWAAGVFKAGKDATNTKNETYAFTSRLVFTPVNEDANLVHLGVSFSRRDLGNNTYKFAERAEVHTADKIVYSATVDASSMNTFGFEAATVKGSFSAQAEYYSADVSANTGSNATFDGYYVMGSYFLTGESRPYKHGSFGKVKPNSDAGAWELVARYSVLDGRNSGAGVEGKNVTLGVNYYLNPSMRVMADFVSTDLTSATPLAQDTGNALSLRFQYIW